MVINIQRIKIKNMVESVEGESFFEARVYFEITGCFPGDKLDLFLKKNRVHDVTVQELLDFLKRQFVTDEFKRQWEYNSDQQIWENRSLNETFKQTVANSFVKLYSDTKLRLKFGSNYFFQESEDEVRKIQKILSLLHRFTTTEDFQKKTDSLFQTN